MPWIYHQSTGVLEHNGVMIATGYSGKGKGKNNPALESMHDVGPIPRGRYRIGMPERSVKIGPHILRLFPSSHTTVYGRTDFEIHGESIHNPPGLASAGCIILPLSIRQQISNNGDHILDVVY